jgi:hypothetical protein
LGTAQHFDLADVESPSEGPQAREIQIIDHEAHGGVRRFTLVLGVFADAANLEITGPRSATCPGEVGNLVHQIPEVANSARAEGGVIEDRHASRDPFQRRSPEVARDADRCEG